MLDIGSIEYSYKYSLRVEDKLKRMNQGDSRGKEKQVKDKYRLLKIDQSLLNRGR